jgi:hypothetical protein
MGLRQKRWQLQVPANRATRSSARGETGWSDVLVAVLDSGLGLNPESFDRLFDAFYLTCHVQAPGVACPQTPAPKARVVQHAITAPSCRSRYPHCDGEALSPPIVTRDITVVASSCRAPRSPSHRALGHGAGPRRLASALASVSVRDGLAGWGGRTRNSASGICVPAGFTAVVLCEEGRLCTRLLAFGTRSAATLCAPR